MCPCVEGPHLFVHHLLMDIWAVSTFLADVTHAAVNMRVHFTLTTWQTVLYPIHRWGNRGPER